MKLAIVTDSTAYISPEQIGDLPIRVVTTPIIIDDVTYNEGVDITTAEFYARMRTAKTAPKTAQPRLGDVLTTHADLAAAGYDTVLNIYLSATISGINSTIQAAQKNIPDVKVAVYDSQITVAMLGEMVLTAGRMAQAGKSLDEIYTELDLLRASTDEYFVVTNLQHLVRGGRLSSTAGLLGTMLSIRPLLTFDNDSHKIVVAEKIRTTAKAFARVEALFSAARAAAAYPLKVWIIDADDAATAASWQTSLQKQFPNVAFERSYFGPAIGTHVGAGTVALAWMRDSSFDLS